MRIMFQRRLVNKTIWIFIILGTLFVLVSAGMFLMINHASDMSQYDKVDGTLIEYREVLNSRKNGRESRVMYQGVYRYNYNNQTGTYTPNEVYNPPSIIPRTVEIYIDENGFPAGTPMPKWVMIIVLIFGLLGLTFLVIGIVLRKRYSIMEV